MAYDLHCMGVERERERGGQRERPRQREKTGFLVGMPLGLIGNKRKCIHRGKEIAETRSQIKKKCRKKKLTEFSGDEALKEKLVKRGS